MSISEVYRCPLSANASLHDSFASVFLSCSSRDGHHLARFRRLPISKRIRGDFSIRRWNRPIHSSPGLCDGRRGSAVQCSRGPMAPIWPIRWPSFVGDWSTPWEICSRFRIRVAPDVSWYVCSNLNSSSIRTEAAIAWVGIINTLSTNSISDLAIVLVLFVLFLCGFLVAFFTIEYRSDVFLGVGRRRFRRAENYAIEGQLAHTS